MNVDLKSKEVIEVLNACDSFIKSWKNSCAMYITIPHTSRLLRQLNVVVPEIFNFVHIDAFTTKEEKLYPTVKVKGRAKTEVQQAITIPEGKTKTFSENTIPVQSQTTGSICNALTTAGNDQPSTETVELGDNPSYFTLV